MDSRYLPNKENEGRNLLTQLSVLRAIPLARIYKVYTSPVEDGRIAELIGIHPARRLVVST